MVYDYQKSPVTPNIWRAGLCFLCPLEKLRMKDTEPGVRIRQHMHFRSINHRHLEII